MSFRFSVAWATSLLLFTGCGSFAKAAPAPQRIVVKLRAPIAETMESAMAANSMALTRSSAASADVQGFLNTYAVHRLTPVYPHLLAVKHQSGRTDRQMAAAVQRRFAKRAGRLRGAFAPPDISPTYVVELEPGQNSDPVLKQLRADPRVVYAEPDQKASASLTPNDPYFNSTGSWGQSYDDLWGIKKINAPAAWDTTMGQGIVVAVVDSGLDCNHPDIAANVWTNPNEIAGNALDDDGDGYADDVYGWNFAYSDSDVADEFGHGTHVAGTIAAVGNNGIGVIGVAPGARVMPVKIMDATGTCDMLVCVQGIVYAADRGADVINLSWGTEGQPQILTDAIDYAYNLGAVIVASAGNGDADVSTGSPAALWNVIAVSAIDSTGARAGFSNWGSRIDMAAPGMDILSLQAAGTALGLVVSDGYVVASGTSMAAPHVSGLAALLLAAHPEYSSEDVRQALRVSASGSDFAGGLGYGYVNASAALAVQGVVEAKIKGPVDGTFSLTPLTILGIARGAGFASYTLSYGQYPAGPGFVTINSGTTATVGELGVFNPATANCVDCAIRLTVYNTAGQAFTDQIRVSTGTASFESPVGTDVYAAYTYKPGTAIQIKGSAVRADFQNCQLQWAPGVTPAEGWSSDGLSLADGGTTAVTNGLLGTWTTPAGLGAGYYTLRLTVNGSNGPSSVTTAQAVVYMEPDLISSRWPIGLSGAPAQGPGLVPAANADGTTRLVLAQQDLTYLGAALWTFPMDGSPLVTGLPLSGSYGQPAVASLDGGAADEVVVSDESFTEVFRPDGVNFSTIHVPQSADFSAAQPQSVHLSSNSEWNILSVGEDYLDGAAYLYAWRPDGSPAGVNFPIQLNDLNDMSWVYSGIRCIVADLDGDGHNDIVALDGPDATTYALKRFQADGSPASWLAPVQSGVPHALAAADLDRNGRMETIVAATDGEHLSVTVFQPDGSLRSGWPVSLPVGISYDGQVFVAVADLKRNGQEEIIVSDEGHIYVLNSDGTAFTGAWPVPADDAGSIFGAVAVGDIDGDGMPEIVTSHWNMYDLTLRAYRSNGTLARSWKLTGRRSLDPAPLAGVTIGDFNHDGITDIAVSYMTGSATSANGVVTVLSTGAPFRAALNDWPMIYQNPQNSAVFVPAQLPPCTGNECSLPPRQGGGHGDLHPLPGSPVRHR